MATTLTAWIPWPFLCFDNPEWFGVDDYFHPASVKQNSIRKRKEKGKSQFQIMSDNEMTTLTSYANNSIRKNTIDLRV